MSEPFTRVTLFVPGTAGSEAAWHAGLQPLGLGIDGGALAGVSLDAPVEVEWIPNDGAFGRAFSSGALPEATVRAIDAAPSALALHWPVDLRDGRTLIVAVVERLRDAGALAVRIEQSKLGWAIDDWLAAFAADDVRSWYRAGVMLLHHGGALQSCGMHAFSLPDVRAEIHGDGPEVEFVASVLSMYQMGEDPLLLSGQTFAPDPGSARRVVERWPDDGHPPRHPCHNPYGVWRLGPVGGTKRPVPSLARVFVPSLAATLLAEESREGRALTREEVESLRDAGSCTTMQHRDAQALERSRGYADLDPELAWEQWQLVRRFT